jgi:predicted XRE-type DNA-binding protein
MTTFHPLNGAMEIRATLRTELDRVLAEAGLSREDVARDFRVSLGRVGQIVRGHGVSYYLADDLQRYINRAAGRMVCRNEDFIKQRKEPRKRR